MKTFTGKKKSFFIYQGKNKRVKILMQCQRQTLSDSRIIKSKCKEHLWDNWENLNIDWILYHIKDKILRVMALWLHF